jgi:alkylation response protein AidB-like acyl-CoA dehydrogenase
MSESATASEKAPYGLDSEMRQMVLDTVAQLSKRLLAKDKVLEWDKKEIFPEETIREMLGPEIGLQLLMIPEKYGGMGGGAKDSVIVTREMSKICLGITTAFFAIQLGADPLVVGGTVEQKEKWLGAIAEGNALVAYAVTEPGAGSDVANIKTKAEPVVDDSGKVVGYKINGTKQFISTGGAANFITLLAKTPEGPSFFVIEKGTEGYVPGRSEEKHGIRASQTSQLTFTDVFVPVENLIGGIPGKGFKQANQVFGYTRLMVAAMGLGAGQAALDIAIPYARERFVSGSLRSPIDWMPESATCRWKDRLPSILPPKPATGLPTMPCKRSVDMVIPASSKLKRSSATLKSPVSMRAPVRCSRTLSVPSAGEPPSSRKVTFTVLLPGKWLQWRRALVTPAAAIMQPPPMPLTKRYCWFTATG